MITLGFTLIFGGVSILISALAYTQAEYNNSHTARQNRANKRKKTKIYINTLSNKKSLA